MNNTSRLRLCTVVPARMSCLMDELRNNEELRKLFKKKGWVRICRECGEFVGNTANWIEHTVKTHIKTHIKTVKTHIKMEPARMNRLDDESGEGLIREDSFLNNLKKCDVRGERDVEDKGVSGDQELSSELVDEKGDDEVDDEELASELVLELVLELVDEDGDDDVFLKEQEIGDRQQEVLGPDRDQLEEEKGDKELCSLCSLLKNMDGDQDLLLEEEKGDNQLEEEEGDLCC